MTAPAAASETIVLYGLDFEAFRRIDAALAECHPRLTYSDGALEMWSVLYGLSWESYLEFLDAVGDLPLRHTYSQGTLEMMSPRKDHDWVKKIIGRCIEAMALDLDISMQSVGSTTLISSANERGLQPDEAYYVQNEPRVRGKLSYDPQTDPPPDLVVEVDVTNSCVKRLPNYAAVGVPELWRHDGKRLRFLGLGPGGEYAELPASRAFPFLAADDLNDILQAVTQLNENALVRRFVERARQRYQAHAGGSAPA